MREGAWTSLASGLLPILLLAVLLAAFIAFGPLGIFKSTFPPIEEISFERVALERDQIRVDVINDGQAPVPISQVLVNDAYNKFEISKRTLNHLEGATITLVYPWSGGLPLRITLLTSEGVTFTKEVPVATETPKFDLTYMTTFTLLGLYVGVMPVFLGLLWLPFLRTLKRKWYDFLLSLTLGLLAFLAADALEGALELSGEVASSFQGAMLIPIGFLTSFLVLLAIGDKTGSVDVTKRGMSHALVLSYMVALGIGAHNLGEGLAIGGAYSVGEVALGTLLVIGFMMHNLTEGIAIVAPITRHRADSEIKHLVLLGLLAGGPTIIGTWIGGFAFSALWSVLFLAIGAGAIAQVITGYMRGEVSGTLFTFTNISGFFAGLFIMYLTGLFVL